MVAALLTAPLLVKRNKRVFVSRIKRTKLKGNVRKAWLKCTGNNASDFDEYSSTDRSCVILYLAIFPDFKKKNGREEKKGEKKVAPNVSIVKAPRNRVRKKILVAQKYSREENAGSGKGKRVECGRYDIEPKSPKSRERRARRGV